MSEMLSGVGDALLFRERKSLLFRGNSSTPKNRCVDERTFRFARKFIYVTHVTQRLRSLVVEVKLDAQRTLVR
jgi:hypothetical protein